MTIKEIERKVFPISCEDDNEELNAVEIDGYSNTWSAFEGVMLDNGTYYIFENDVYGDMTCFLVVQYLDDTPTAIYETYDGLIQCLIDEELEDITDY